MSDDAIAALHRRLDDQDKVLRSIDAAISGDEDMGHEGLAHRMARCERRTDDHEKKFWIWGGIATGLSFALTELRRLIK